jgi:hypothetical protein
MEDTQLGTDAPSTDTPPQTTANGTPPKHQSPIDQTKDAARKVLAMITGHSRS